MENKQLEIHKRYLKMAFIWATNSKATRLKVGALLVKNNAIISDGYNGTLSGMSNCCEYVEYKRKPHPYLDDVEADTDGNIYYKNKKLIQRLHCSGKYTQSKIKGVYYHCGRIVMETFVENPDKEFFTQVNHINYDVTDNSIMNLEWCSNRFNSIHRDARRPKTSNYPGVSKCSDRDKYVGQAYVDGKLVKKRFDNEYDAYQFYKSNVDARDFISIKYTDTITKPEVLHAESNAITKIARSAASSEGATMYITDAPCFQCSKLIIQSGIKEVVYARSYRDESGINLLRKAGVTVTHVPIDGWENLMSL